VLARTLGVPIFQEQVMQLAMVAAGFTRRRGRPAAPRDGGLAAQGRLERFRRSCSTAWTTAATTPTSPSACAGRSRASASYGFPESHAASFALLVYASAWLKCHEPAAFLAALLNSQPMGFYAPSQLVQDARRHGVEVRARWSLRGVPRRNPDRWLRATRRP
jgi:error-prone DNA polymerase